MFNITDTQSIYIIWIHIIGHCLKTIFLVLYRDRRWFGWLRHRLPVPRRAAVVRQGTAGHRQRKCNLYNATTRDFNEFLASISDPLHLRSRLCHWHRTDVPVFLPKAQSQGVHLVLWRHRHRAARLSADWHDLRVVRLLFAV